MSKQSEAKKAQNYQDKPLARRCRECPHLSIKMVPKTWNREFFDERISCSIGGFAVKANSICDLFERKE